MTKKISAARTKVYKRTFWENIAAIFREGVWDIRIISLPGSKQIFSSFSVFFKLSRFKFIRDRMPETDPERNNMSWLPINRNIESAGEIALPEAVLDRFIEKAKHRVIVNFCGCREAMRCKEHPSDIGCLMMGESALEIPAKSSREVSVEEAKAHVRKATTAGLVPIVGKTRLDNDLFMIPDRGKLLTVCFCCNCCCITRFTRYVPAETLNKIQHPVEGLSMNVTDKCVGCGSCVDVCYLGAIKIENDRAVMSDLCRVCGRCALQCPEGAIKLKLDNPNATEDVIRRIEASVDF